MANQLTPDPETLLPFQPRVTTQIPEAQIANPPPQFNVATPSVTNASELLELQTLREQLRNIPKLQEEVLSALTPTEEQLAAEKGLEEARIKGVALEAGLIEGEAKIRAQAIPQPLIGRQREVLQEQVALQQKLLATQVLPLELKLGRLQRAQETKVGLLKAKLGFAEKAIDTAITLQKLTRPDVLKTDILDSGEVVSIIQDPISGKVTTKVIGSVSPKTQEKFKTIGEFKSANNEMVVYGVTRDGQYQEIKRTPIADINKAESRDLEVSQFLEARKGTDGFISAIAYQEGLRKWIAKGGTQSSFSAAFPQTMFLRELERAKLPPALQGVSVVSAKQLSQEQLSIVNDAKARIDRARQFNEPLDQIRNEIIKRSIEQFGFDPSPFL